MAKTRHDQAARLHDDERISRGYGQGRGADYQPWFRVEEFFPLQPPPPFLLTPGWKTPPRSHHLIGELAIAYFFVLEWSTRVTEIREDFPLFPAEKTVALAQSAGWHHPRLDNRPVVMTTSFLVNYAAGQATGEQALALRWSAEAETERELEHLAIEQSYWEDAGVIWKVLTEEDIPFVLAQNVRLLHPYRDLNSFRSCSAEQFRSIAAPLTEQIQLGTHPLNEAARICDEAHGLESGTCLALAYHLLATRQWQIDMHQPLLPDAPLDLLKVNLQALPLHDEC